MEEGPPYFTGGLHPRWPTFPSPCPDSVAPVSRTIHSQGHAPICAAGNSGIGRDRPTGQPGDGGGRARVGVGQERGTPGRLRAWDMTWGLWVL